ncbi:Uncharacterised protein [Mycobacteroides abscessus subsp. abscessus]|nr:Uncharacterised protein [Mycobacteroides abscessus subsp. abscessus]
MSQSLKDLGLKKWPYSGGTTISCAVNKADTRHLDAPRSVDRPFFRTEDIHGMADVIAGIYSRAL